MSVRCFFFGIFDAFPILNGYLLDAQVKQAQNSGSETSVKKVKFDLYNQSYLQNAMYRFFWVTLYIQKVWRKPMATCTLARHY